MQKFLFPFLLFCLILIMVTAFSIPKQTVFHPIEKPWVRIEKPTISKEWYGDIEGQNIYRYILKNTSGMFVAVINYGCTITDIITPDKNQEMGSVVLGFDSLKSYTGRENPLLGAVVGRIANRITNKQFTLDGKTYTLTSNIHGGQLGFDKKIWDIAEVPGDKEVSLKMTYLSKDGEEGFPGNLNVTIIYTLTNQNELKIRYTATTDKATPVVLTNHTYFNLSGGKNATVLDTKLNILADQFLEATPGPFPDGNFLEVKATPFDFTRPTKIGDHIADTNQQLTMSNGYDLTYVLRNQTGKLALAATAYEQLSGRVMQVYTTEPGMVFYSANYLSEKMIGRGGIPLTKNGAFCLETQHYPDSPNEPKFPNTILRPGQIYSSQTVYKFSVHR
jgi:aldose 1-epimerase